MGPILSASPLVLQLATELERLGPLNEAVRPEAVFFVDPPDPFDLLRQAGILESADRVHDKWVGALAPLCSTSLEYIADYVVDGTRFCAVAVTGAGGSTLALRRSRDDDPDFDVVELREAKDDEVLPGLLDLLGLRPGTGHRVSVYLEDVRKHNRSLYDSPPSPEHKKIGELLSMPTVGPSVEITVGVRDRNRSYRYTKNPLCIAEYEWGHFANWATGEGDQAQIHAAPATHDYLITALDELRSALT